MENASKALLIAGAILLAILIISLGIGVFRGANDITNKNNLDPTEIDAFNLKWSGYEGTRVSASQVNGLLSTALSHNQSEYSSGTYRFIYVKINANTSYGLVEQSVGPETDEIPAADATDKQVSNYLNSKSTRVSAVTNYKVEVTGRTPSGLIRKITVTAN